MKQFLKTVLFCHKELFFSNKSAYIIYALLTIPRGFVPLLWSYSLKILVDTATRHMYTGFQTFQLSELNMFFILGTIWIITTVLPDSFGNHIEEVFNRGYRATFRLNFINKISELDLQTFEDSKFINDLELAKPAGEKIRTVYKTSLRTIRTFIQVIVSTIALLYLGWFVPIIILFVVLIGIQIRNSYNKEYRAVDKIVTPAGRKAGYLYELFFNRVSLEEIKLYGLKKTFVDRIRDIDSDNRKKFTDVTRNYILVFSLLAISEKIIIDFGIRLYAFWKIINGFLTVGDFIFINNQINSFSSGMTELGLSLNELNRLTLEIEDLLQINKTQKVLDYSNSTQTFEKKKFDIEFKDLTFKYPGNDAKLVYDKMNLKIFSGEKIAIVGLNGAGKSTLVKLLLRYYDPTSGKILINGVDLRNIDMDYWYSNIGVLFQDFKKYEVSVADNVYFGKVTDIGNAEKLSTSIAKSSAAEFVGQYAHKENQMLSRQYDDGVEPSGGQWQKIALARTFFRDAPILILDEPTSAIDAKAEAEIFDRVNELSRDKTVIIISHRFSTVRNADRIIVIDNGKILEQGSHQELLTLNGKYAELFDLQAKGYR